MLNHIIQCLEDALKLTKKKSILFRYTDKINFNTNYISSVLNTSYQTFHFKYSDNIEYIGIDRCMEYPLHFKKELEALKKIKLSVHSFGKDINEDVKIFGGVGFNMTDPLKKPWDGIPVGLFIIPKILITKKDNHYFISYYYTLNKDSDVQKIVNEYNLIINDD